MRMIAVWFILLISAFSATGKLIFVENLPDKVVEGTRVDFICRDSNKDISDPSWADVNIDWTYRNQSGSFPIARNGSLVNNISTDRFVLVPDSGLTILRVRISDSGVYRCEIKENSQEASLTAEALLKVHLSHNASAKEGPTRDSTYTNTSICATNSSAKNSVVFDGALSTPEVTMTDEDKTLVLVCSYCITTRMLARVTWFKDSKPVISNAKRVVNKNKLTITNTKYGQDDGLYACVVNGEKGHVNGTRLMTVLIEKPQGMPQILTSVWARNITCSSVTIRWRIRNQGPYVFSHVSLKLRQLSSSTWQYDVKELPEETTHYNFPQLKPGVPYLLHIVAENNRGEQDAETLMFWTARFNSTDFSSTEQILYLASDKRALGVALGVVGFFVALIAMYVCFTWANNRHGYKSPQRHERHRGIVHTPPLREMDILNTNTAARNHYFHYNRAFTDEEDNLKHI